MGFDRISVDHQVMGGVPCIAGTRIPVATIVSMLAEGVAEQAIVDLYPQLTVHDIRDALEYAAEMLRVRELPLRQAV